MGYQPPTDDSLLLARVLTQFPPPALPPDDHNPFARLMSDLVSNSNATRARAEQHLRHLHKNSPALLCHKTSLLLCSPRVDTRLVSAILLRQFLTPTSEFYLWPWLSQLCQFYTRVVLLLSLEEEEIRHVANAKGDAIAQLASSFAPNLHVQYPELLNFVLVRMALSKPAMLVEASLRIFGQIVKPLVHVLEERLSTLRSVIAACVNHPTSSDVRLVALSALFSLLRCLPCSKDRNKLHDVLIKAVSKVEIADVPKVLELLVDFAGAEPDFFRKITKHTDIVVDSLAVAESGRFEEGIRHLALEFVITLVEAKNPATVALCKMRIHGTRVLGILLEMLLDVDDDSAWLGAQLEGKETDQRGNYALALESLDRLVSALGGNVLLESAEETLPAYLMDSDWKKRHAALVALAHILQGCSTEVDLGDLFHKKGLIALVAAMGDFENPCIQVSAAMALTSFIEKCNKDILIPYLDEIVGKIVLLLKRGKLMVKEGAVSALTSVAEACMFCKYFDVVVPHLMRILTNSTNKNHKMLLAKSADCISVIGCISGKDKFRKYVQAVMGILISLQDSLNPEDPVTHYVFRATNTMCNSLRHEFLPYMDTLMKPLLECVQLNCDYGLASSDSADVQSFDLGNDILNEKAYACNILFDYIKSLEEHFFPWAEKVALVLAPLIDFKTDVEVRKVSAKAMYELLKSAKMAIEKKISQDSSAVKRMLTFMLPKFLDGIHKEQDLETCVFILESLNHCLELSARYLTNCQIGDIVNELKFLIISSDARMRERGKIKTEHYNDEEELISDESLFEDLIIGHVGDCLTILIETFKATFLPFFDELTMYIKPMMVSEEAIEKRRVSVNTFVDIAENCGDAAVRYYDAYLPSLLLACNDSDRIIRQSGVYGVALCAKFGGSEFRPFVSEALAKINNVIDRSDALGPDNALAYQNAVLALGWICRLQKFRTREKTIATWLNCLPITQDLGEAMAIHELFCSMVVSSDRQLFGENNKNLTEIISVFTEILSSSVNLVTEQTRKKMVITLKKLKSQSSQSTLKMG